KSRRLLFSSAKLNESPKGIVPLTISDPRRMILPRIFFFPLSRTQRQVHECGGITQTRREPPRANPLQRTHIRDGAIVRPVAEVAMTDGWFVLAQLQPRRYLGLPFG